MQRNFMGEALKLARTAFEKNEVPVGAVVIRNGKVIGAAHNQNLLNFDPTAHAEILALRYAAQEINSPRLDDCDLYVTLEPCAMCAAAISLARIKRVYYGASDKKFGSVENGVKFFSSSSCFHSPEIYSGIAEEEAAELMVKFFTERRAPARLNK